MDRKQPTKNTLIKLTLLAMMLLGLPLIGIVLAGKPSSIYLAFPPKTLYVEPAPFAWVPFIAYSLFSIASTRRRRAGRRKRTKPSARHR